MKARKRPGPPKGHAGWGGRPKGQTMPCGWGCGANLTTSEIRAHFATCPRSAVAQLSPTEGPLVDARNTVRA